MSYVQGNTTRGLSLVGARRAGRWSARRKVSVVLELLRGADLESLNRRHVVRAAKLSQWRDEFLAGGEARLKHREEAVEITTPEWH